ncbi:unnamed protein product [Moneuplotes crassus]|uniref:DNA-directed RNA polymerases I, II, and III subunit RPABC3 n=1 Tax=Euplotes crassus TaxID=5936 RepID=A0AAD2D7K9_EUPCR|nr:unnamed protein product [Moneuplotes crassus]
MQNNILIDDTLKVKEVNRDGKHFDKVSRINGVTEVYEYEITLDVHADYIKEGSLYKIALTNEMDLDEEDSDYYGMSSLTETVFKDYDYVMHGKVFRFDIKDENNISQYISFGGLILKITGDIKYLKNLEIDSKVFLMLKECK